MLLFEDKTGCDEEGVLFYPNGDMSMMELEKILAEAYEKGYPDSQKMACGERVRLSDPTAELPVYDRRAINVSLGELKRIYGRPYNPDEVAFNPALLLIVDGELYDVGS
jgi:hypothetical protein